MATVDPNSGDLQYLKLIAQYLGDNVNQFQLFREQLYLLIGTLKMKNGAGDFGFYSVATEGDLPVPTKPSFGYAQDTGVYYVYNLIDAAWQKVGIILP